MRPVTLRIRPADPEGTTEPSTDRRDKHGNRALAFGSRQLLPTTFADRKQGLEGQWHRGEEVATEDLRPALRQYRSFFDRLLSA
ncbi:hypothetical protein ACFWVU_25090 [Streptomyces sp. NPDC058686]|uniref:hypothetical protein n=1 Tax=Streptomyces sp. NPDC058686 TaxID=3346599 RepID=UPI00366A0489